MNHKDDFPPWRCGLLEPAPSFHHAATLASGLSPPPSLPRGESLHLSGRAPSPRAACVFLLCLHIPPPPAAGEETAGERRVAAHGELTDLRLPLPADSSLSPPTAPRAGPLEAQHRTGPGWQDRCTRGWLWSHLFLCQQCGPAHHSWLNSSTFCQCHRAGVCVAGSPSGSRITGGGPAGDGGRTR